MKTIRITHVLAVTAAAIALTFTACKKDKDTPGEDLRVANDNAKVDNDIEMAFKDVNDAFSQSSIAQRVASPNDIQAGWQPPCGASVDTSLLQSDKQVTFSFDGSTVCLNRIRSGNIVAKLITGNRWSDVGAVLQLTFTNFAVTYTSTNQTFTYNGTKTIKNVNGGLVRNLGPGSPSVVHKVRGNLSVTFEDGTQRTWWITRRNTYSFNNGFELVSAGDTLMANPDTILALIPYTVGGVTRYGADFKYRAPIDIVTTSACGWDKPVQGQRILLYNDRGVTVTLGVDAMGNPAGGACAYGYKVEWTRLNGQLASAVIAY